ncbi:MAG TPA: right-handed parallel beta-helix repeat-containing protein [Bacteroidia bacterium]|jgi:parallel beta-helix repeat protein|nr:right-handed parallel beta-helix repeat-containing protein [Bacteroidia bacterium]
MRKLYCITLLLCLSVEIEASNYYFSTTTGDDTRTFTQAQNPATPWKTITKLNFWFNHFQPGDSILFNRGDGFPGTISIQKSGTTSLPIVLSAYGNKTLALPIITGFITPSAWVSISSGIWQGSCTGCGTTVNSVLVNGTPQAMGRYPNANTSNKGYLNFESHISTTSITDNQLSSTPNWTGAQMVLRPNRWVLDRDSITNHSGTLVQYISQSGYTPLDNFGYFIQNSVSTLDQAGEWYYNPSSKMIELYTGSSTSFSGTAQVSALNNLVLIKGQNNIVFDRLQFTGSNQDAFSISSASNITIQHCSVLYSGANAVTASGTKTLKILFDTIRYTNNTALCLSSNCNAGSILNNIIKYTGIYPGMGQSGNSTYEGILISGNNNTIEFNTIDSTGYSAIEFEGDTILIRNNFITYFNLSKDDGGGIYTWTGASNTTASVNRVINGNIILYGVGAGAGTDTPDYFPSEGIYMDDNTGFVTITNNTVAHCGDDGILLHNAHNITVRQNTLFDNSQQVEMGHDAICPTCPITQVNMKQNIAVSKQTDQDILSLSTMANDISGFGTFDSNSYCRPYDDNICFANAYVASSTNEDVFQDLNMWKAAYLKDPASKKSPLTYAPYTISGYNGSNMYPNGTFMSNVNGLYTYSAGGNENAVWTATSPLDAGALKMYFASGGSSSNIAEIIIGAGSVTAAHNYVVKFSLIGTRNNVTLNSFFRQSNSPYNVLSAPVYTKISTTRTEVQLLLSPTVSESNASLLIQVVQSDSTLWIDNLQIYDANIVMNNPDDNILFAYNASSASISVPLTGAYIDVKSNNYYGNVSIAPYSSAILLKQGAVTDITKLHMPDGKLQLYPNPSSGVITIIMPLEETGERNVQLYDLSGKLVFSKTISSYPSDDSFTMDISSLIPGAYVFSLRTGKSSWRTMLIKTDR